MVDAVPSNQQDDMALDDAMALAQRIKEQQRTGNWMPYIERNRELAYTLVPVLAAEIERLRANAGALAAMILQNDRAGALEWARGARIVIGADGAPTITGPTDVAPAVPDAERAKLADQLEEASTCLDEQFHRDEICNVMLRAARVLRGAIEAPPMPKPIEPMYDKVVTYDEQGRRVTQWIRSAETTGEPK